MSLPFKPASCGVHETRGGGPCTHCPQVLKELRLQALVLVPKRVYTKPTTQTPGAIPPNLRAKTRRGAY